MKKVALLITATFVFAGCTQKTTSTPSLTDLTQQGQLDTTQKTQQQNIQQKGIMKTLADFENIEATQATINTTKGAITIELFREKAPITTANFLNLVKDGYYEGIVFHRVMPDFMAQVGDPKTKDPALQAEWGSGGPGYTIPDEFDPSLRHDKAGVVSMANAGANTGGSQFFMTYEPTPWLDDVHSIFGQITDGMDVLEQIEVGDKIIDITYQ